MRTYHLIVLVRLGREMLEHIATARGTYALWLELDLLSLEALDEYRKVMKLIFGL